ncbi:hypothetical protein HAX54_011900 [Datura stramonium]|uniref:Uncharacterized protein n=1 Tax=Datura stramonium TaxID=4076 RepID=A0ABS8TKR1_DATST|nr:hypothetical protein [Datura stramonium]
MSASCTNPAASTVPSRPPCLISVFHGPRQVVNLGGLLPNLFKGLLDLRDTIETSPFIYQGDIESRGNSLATAFRANQILLIQCGLGKQYGRQTSSRPDVLDG